MAFSNTSTTSTIRRSSRIRGWPPPSGRLPGRKFILTNGSLAHAEKVAARLGVTAISTTSSTSCGPT